MGENCKMKKVLSVLLLCAMILGTAACTSSGDAAETTTAAPSDVETTVADTTVDENDRASAKSTLDESLDFNGKEIRVGYVGTPRYATDILGADDGDVINEAIYARNLNVEENLGVKLVPVEIDEATGKAADRFLTLVMSGDDVVDINTGHQSYLTNKLFDGIFTNIADDPYISWDSPWWATEYMEEIEIGDDRRYFLFGDISLMMLKSAGAIYFNKGLFENQFKSSDELYADVLDGKWTMDMMYEYTSQAYQDLNGNATIDDGDLFGFSATTSKSVEHFQYDAGIRTTKRNSDGMPEIMLNNEKTILFAEKLYNLYYNNTGAKIYTTDAVNDVEQLNMFKNGEMMFNPSWFYTAELLRDMEADYGIIPYPKLDEAQEDYMTLVHNGSTTFCVPMTISDDTLDMIGAVLEEMAFQSYQLVTPAYFEVAMKAKYSRDNLSSQLLDVMYESMYTDFGYCFSSKLNGIGMLRNLAADKTADFASFYAEKEEGALAALDDLMELYLEGVY